MFSDNRGGRPIQSIEPLPLGLGEDVLNPKAQSERAKAPEQTADRRGDKGAKGTPPRLEQTLLEQDELAAVLGVAVVHGAEQEDREDAAEAADNDLEAAPPVALVRQANDKHGNGGSRDEVRDEVDLQDGRGADGEDDDRDDDDDDAGADPPDVEPVAKEVVGGRRDHGGLERVKGGGAEGHGHDEHEADDPRREEVDEREEGDGAVDGVLRIAGVDAGPGGDQAGAADEGDDAEDGDDGDGDADPEVFVGFGGEGAEPEA